MYLRSPTYSTKTGRFTVILKTPTTYNKFSYLSYDEAIIAALSFYLPKETILAAAEVALSRDALRVRNLRVSKFAKTKEERSVL